MVRVRQHLVKIVVVVNKKANTNCRTQTPVSCIKVWCATHPYTTLTSTPIFSVKDILLLLNHKVWNHPLWISFLGYRALGTRYKRFYKSPTVSTLKAKSQHFNLKVKCFNFWRRARTIASESPLNAEYTAPPKLWSVASKTSKWTEIELLPKEVIYLNKSCSGSVCSCSLADSWLGAVCPAQATAGPSGSGVGGAERLASSPLFKWISIMAPRLSRHLSSPQGGDWFIEDQPAIGRWKPLYQSPFTDNNEAE